MEKSNGIKVGHELPLHNAGRDVLLEALNSPIQARNPNVSRLPENQPGYKPPLKWSDYSEMPAYRFTNS